jgi:hypothetical protein
MHQRRGASVISEIIPRGCVGCTAMTKKQRMNANARAQRVHTHSSEGLRHRPINLTKSHHRLRGGRRVSHKRSSTHAGFAHIPSTSAATTSAKPEPRNHTIGDLYRIHPAAVRALSRGVFGIHSPCPPSRSSNFVKRTGRKQGKR